MLDERPLILAVDGDADALERISEELQRYVRDYRVACVRSTAAALEHLEEVRGRDAAVAIVLAARGTQQIRGEDLLARVHELYPHAKRALLISWGGWADAETANAIRNAMRLRNIDYYALKPWSRPDELFHRLVSEFLHEWRRAHAPGRREITVVADPWSPAGYELRNLLARNGVPHAFHTPGSEEGREFLLACGHDEAGVPVVVLPDGSALVDPKPEELAQRGTYMQTELDDSEPFDIVLVGAGRAGLAAAVSLSAGGMRALCLERESIGGQAGSSAKIRNYLGFARGLSGAELTQRAYQQAWVFGATFLLTRSVTGIRCATGRHVVTLSSGAEVEGRAVVLAMGVSYRRLAIPALRQFEGVGVFYGSTPSEAGQFAGRSAYVVGGGNSAGQIAIHLSRYARHVTVVVRGASLSEDMSGYLRDEIAGAENISVRLNTEVVGAEGAARLERLTLRDAHGTTTEDADALFILIGAQPRTDWLPAEIERDPRGFVVTDSNFETTVPGVFAVGDVRAGSMKNVSSAVGEGAVMFQRVVEGYMEREGIHWSGK